MMNYEEQFLLLKKSHYRNKLIIFIQFIIITFDILEYNLSNWAMRRVQ